MAAFGRDLGLWQCSAEPPVGGGERVKRSEPRGQGGAKAGHAVGPHRSLGLAGAHAGLGDLLVVQLLLH